MDNHGPGNLDGTLWETITLVLTRPMGDLDFRGGDSGVGDTRAESGYTQKPPSL